MGRPKESTATVTKWAIWKRAQRETKAASKCASCGKSVSGRGAHRDHAPGQLRKPGAKLTTLCASCHMSKGRKRGQV